MSRVLPILFNMDMVRAILDGRKTVTRRVAKKIPVEVHRIEPIQPFDSGNLEFECHWGGYMPDVPGFTDGVTVVKPPYQPGVILYVRETWNTNPLYDYGNELNKYVYKADYDGHAGEFGWRPSIHMPKEAARIWLKVKDVRVEHLQDITEEQVDAEGFQFKPPCLSMVLADGHYCDLDGPCASKIKYCDMSAGELFGKVLWNSTIKKSDLARYGWDANPWVWVIEFERCEKLEGC